MLAFVGYQLFGTSVAEARAQDRLKQELKEGNALDAIRTVPGGALGLIEIPKIGVDKAIVEGVGTDELKAAPGHYPGTPLPGRTGNSAIAGHRTTYGAPFNRLDELVKGDAILVTTAEGEFRYEVREAQVVDPGAAEVLNPTGDNRLTLTTCHPEFSARERLIIVADLASPPAGELGEAGEAPSSPGSGDTLELDAGLSGDPAARWPAFAWGLAAATAAILTRVLARFWRRTPAWAIGVPVFLVALFFFFENFARLLPPNV